MRYVFIYMNRIKSRDGIFIVCSLQIEKDLRKCRSFVVLFFVPFIWHRLLFFGNSFHFLLQLLCRPYFDTFPFHLVYIYLHIHCRIIAYNLVWKPTFCAWEWKEKTRMRANSWSSRLTRNMTENMHHCIPCFLTNFLVYKRDMVLCLRDSCIMSY